MSHLRKIMVIIYIVLTQLKKNIENIYNEYANDKKIKSVRVDYV